MGATASHASALLVVSVAQGNGSCDPLSYVFPRAPHKIPTAAAKKSIVFFILRHLRAGHGGIVAENVAAALTAENAPTECRQTSKSNLHDAIRTITQTACRATRGKKRHPSEFGEDDPSEPTPILKRKSANIRNIRLTTLVASI